MPQIDSTYMNLKLSNPIIVASSGLTKSARQIKSCEDAGAGAVVIKSLFEEVLAGKDFGLDVSTGMHAEAYDYLRSELEMQYGPRDYCRVIEDAKKSVDIPVIASINCVSAKWWPSYAKQIESAGADGLELNVFKTAFDPTTSGEDIEKIYFDVIQAVKEKVNIPVAMKIGSYFSSLPNLARELRQRGVDALVLFNRFTELDIDIEKISLQNTFQFSSKYEIYRPLRWIAILSGRIGCDLAATTGIHSAQDMIKMILAGASAVQLASLLYTDGLEKIRSFLTFLESWMTQNNFKTIEEFKGKLSLKNTQTNEIYLRSQFMEKIRGYE
ncbi:dihydroorotate dehydrogenase-like protein [candidate division KSB1 bacterium]|nr:dihydroorotate dehydrogenase-like protein [candidate division KSB1 bacterium]